MAINKGTPKKTGPAGDGTSPTVTVRLPPDVISHIDRWAAENSFNRSEAVRRLIDRALGRDVGQRFERHDLRDDEQSLDKKFVVLGDVYENPFPDQTPSSSASLTTASPTNCTSNAPAGLWATDDKCNDVA